MMEVGAIGSPVDVATFLAVMGHLVLRIRPRVATLAAGLVALAEGRDDVDDVRLAKKLDVDDRAVESLRPVVHRDDNGGENHG